MANVSITASLIAKLKPKAKQYDVRDRVLKGFMLRVYPSGNMTYAVQYKRGGRVTLGKVGVLKAAEARDKAKKIIGDYANGLDPVQAEVKKRGIPTLKQFIYDKYGNWLKTHNVSGDEDIKTIERHFGHLLDKPIDQIHIDAVDSWRTKKLLSGEMKANTINRTITPLRSALSKAVAWKIIDNSGLAGLKILKCDDTRIRFFSQDERKRFFEAIYAREKRIKEKRASANKWRKARGYELYPAINDKDFADHLFPMIIVAMNSGVRKSEEKRINRLTDIDFEQNIFYIRKSKNFLARYIPMNKTSVNALNTWIRQTAYLNSPYLFPSPYNPNKPIVDIKKAWMKLLEDAKIEDFHWHDLRHDFASRLVMAGVSLYTVQKLLGHKKTDQTMKYAHLAPDFIAESVRKLDSLD